MTLARLEIETRITAPSVCSVRGAVPSMPSAAPVPGVGAFVEYMLWSLGNWNKQRPSPHTAKRQAMKARVGTAWTARTTPNAADLREIADRGVSTASAQKQHRPQGPFPADPVFKQDAASGAASCLHCRTGDAADGDARAIHAHAGLPNVSTLYIFPCKLLLEPLYLACRSMRPLLCQMEKPPVDLTRNAAEVQRSSEELV